MKTLIRKFVTAWCVGAAALGTGAACAGAALPPRGADAPAIRLKDLNGSGVNTGAMAPKALVLVFGELGHEGCRKACGEVLDVLTDVRIDKDNVATLLIISQDGTSDHLKEEAGLGRYPETILRDDKREMFGAYHVLVVPTVVIVDSHGKITYAMPGFLQRFKEVLVGAVLTAQGRMTLDEFDAIVNADNATTASPEEVRAGRLVHLGRELTRHGLLDSAAERYAEAIKLAPDNMEAKQGLGELLLKQGKPADAMGMFRAILANRPQDTAASLGLAAARIGAGTNDDITEASTLVRGVLARDAKNARAHYLLGRVHEAEDKDEAATEEYRRAAELLLEEQGTP